MERKTRVEVSGKCLSDVCSNMQPPQLEFECVALNALSS